MRIALSGLDATRQTPPASRAPATKLRRLRRARHVQPDDLDILYVEHGPGNDADVLTARLILPAGTGGRKRLRLAAMGTLPP